MIQVRFKGAEYHLRACISDAHLKDLLLCSICGQGALLKQSRWSQNVCWTPLILDRKTSSPAEQEGQLLIQLQSSSTNTAFLMQEPSVQVYTEQPGQEADARQTNDTCYRTKTIQNNFINSVTFLLCTSVQPYPSSLLLKIDNACFLFRIFLKGRHKTSHQCIIYTSATQSPTPKLIFSLTRYFQQNVNKHHGLSSASEVRL